MNWSSNFSDGADSQAASNAGDATLWSPDDFETFADVKLPVSGGHVPDETLVPAHLLEEARRLGFDDGFRAGEDSERGRLFLVARALQDGVLSVENGVDRWISNAEENISALAVAIARHILSREVTVDRQATLDVVRQAIAEFSIDQPLTVRLHPADHAVIVPMLGDGDTARRSAEWIADARIAPGGCVVEGRERIIDGRVDAALERVYRRLTYTGA